MTMISDCHHSNFEETISNLHKSANSADIEASLQGLSEPSEKRKLLPMNMTASVEKEDEIDPERTFFRLDTNPDCFGTRIWYKTKLMKTESEALPQKLYSTIKYNLSIRTQTLSEPSEHPVIAKLQIRSRRSSCLLETDYNGKDLFRGDSSVAMDFQGKQGRCNLSFRLGNFSFSKKPDELSLILTIESQGTIISQMQSPDFRCYCRKPNKKRPKSETAKKSLGKRSRSSTTSGPQFKTRKLNSSPFESFQQKLDELVDLKSRLHDSQQVQCQNLLMRELTLAFPQLSQLAELKKRRRARAEGTPHPNIHIRPAQPTAIPATSFAYQYHAPLVMMHEGYPQQHYLPQQHQYLQQIQEQPARLPAEFQGPPSPIYAEDLCGLFMS